MKSERRFGTLLVLPALFLVGLFLIVPIVMAFWASLHVDTPLAGYRFIGLGNYIDLAADETALDALGFTLVFVGVSTALEVGLGLLLALLLNEGFRGRGWARAAVLVPWAIPPVVAAVMWKYLLNDQYGLVNLILYGGDLGSYRAWLAEPGTARLSIIIADVWKTSSFAALLILAGLQAIPRELMEAARIDGAGPFRRFFSITLPLLRPAILLAFLFRTMDAFRVFDLVYVMTRGGPGDSTNVLQLYGYQKMFPEQQFGYGSAVSVIVFLLVAIVSVGLVRTVGARVLEK